MKKEISRHDFIKGAMLVATFSLLAGCGETPTPPNNTSPKPSDSNGTSGGSANDTNSSSSSASSSNSDSNSSAETPAPNHHKETIGCLMIESLGQYYALVGNTYHVNCCYKLTNLSKSKAIEYGEIQTTVCNEIDVVLGTSGQTIPAIAAGDSTYYTNTIVVSATDNPSYIRYTIFFDENNDTVNQEEAYIAKSSDMVVKNVRRIRSGQTTYFTGEVENKSQYFLSSINLEVLYKKQGEIYGGGHWTTYLEIEAGKTASFSVSTVSELNDFDSYFFVAVQDGFL